MMNSLRDDAQALKDYKDRLLGEFRVGFEESLSQKFDGYSSKLIDQHVASERAFREIDELYKLMGEIRGMMETGF